MTFYGVDFLSGPVLVVLAGAYLVPSVIAWSRQLPKRLRIFWLNVLLGWTGIGWIIPLMMAVQSKREMSTPSALEQLLNPTQQGTIGSTLKHDHIEPSRKPPSVASAEEPEAPTVEPDLSGLEGSAACVWCSSPDVELKIQVVAHCKSCEREFAVSGAQGVDAAPHTQRQLLLERYKQQIEDEFDWERIREMLSKSLKGFRIPDSKLLREDRAYQEAFAQVAHEHQLHFKQDEVDLERFFLHLR